MLDQFIAWIAPETALRRARARAALSALGARAYEGASRADRMSDWRTTSNSAAAEVAPALELLRDRFGGADPDVALLVASAEAGTVRLRRLIDNVGEIDAPPVIEQVAIPESLP